MYSWALLVMVSLYHCESPPWPPWRFKWKLDDNEVEDGVSIQEMVIASFKSETEYLRCADSPQFNYGYVYAENFKSNEKLCYSSALAMVCRRGVQLQDDAHWLEKALSDAENKAMAECVRESASRGSLMGVGGRWKRQDDEDDILTPMDEELFHKQSEDETNDWSGSATEQTGCATHSTSTGCRGGDLNAYRVAGCSVFSHAHVAVSPSQGQSLQAVSASLSATTSKAESAHRSTSTYEIVESSTAEGTPAGPSQDHSHRHTTSNRMDNIRIPEEKHESDDNDSEMVSWSVQRDDHKMWRFLTILASLFLTHLALVFLLGFLLGFCIARRCYVPRRARAERGRSVASVHTTRRPVSSKSTSTPPPKPKTAVTALEREPAYGVLEKRTQTVDEPENVPEVNVAGKPPPAQPAPAPTQAPAPEPFVPVRAPTATAAEDSPAVPDAFVPARDPRIPNTPLLATQRMSPRIAPVQPANAFNAYNPPRVPQNPAPAGPPKTFDNRGIVASVNIEDAKPRNRMGGPPPSMFYS